jgi:hypothetical protein
MNEKKIALNSNKELIKQLEEKINKFTEKIELIKKGVQIK